MFIPSCNNDISVVINDKLYFLQIFSLYAMTFMQNKLLTIKFKFGKSVFTFYMYMYRLMLFTVKEK